MDVDELLREERVIPVVEDGLELRGAGAAVDFVVDRRERSGCQLA